MTLSSGAATALGRADLSGTDFLIGAAVGVNVAPRIHLRLDYQWCDTDDALLAVDRAAGFEQFAFEIFWRL